MLQEIFYWFFNMSIIAVIAGVIVLLLRRVKKIPRRFVVFLWLIPFLRMTIPIGIGSPYSLMSLISRFTTKTVVVYQPFGDLSFSMTNSIMVADRYFPIAYKINVLDQVFYIASIIWLIVLGTILLVLTVVYVMTLHEMKDATHWHDNIYLSDKILSPAVYGIIKPRIILPTSYKERELEFILLHEKMHIRRADNLWRVLAFVVAAAHWFNPFCWIFLKYFLEDLELSCDEMVLVKLGGDRAKEYAMSLVESKESASVFASPFGGAKIRIRIENILSFKKMTWVSFTAFLTLIITIFCILLTNAG